MSRREHIRKIVAAFFQNKDFSHGPSSENPKISRFKVRLSEVDHGKHNIRRYLCRLIYGCHCQGSSKIDKLKRQEVCPTSWRFACSQNGAHQRTHLNEKNREILLNTINFLADQLLSEQENADSD